MELLKILFPISDFLYVLQLEEYEIERYFRSAWRLFWRRNIEKRGKLVYTKRIKYTLIISLPFCLVVPIFTPIWIGLSNLILSPYFWLVKNRLRYIAKKHFKIHGLNTKVIAIAGSFGKTTTKNYIYELVKYNYRTQMIPGNINTPTGIANWILTKYEPSSQLLIVEVDTYYIGEIAKSLSITPPDIAVLTNIGDQHLERFGTKDKLKTALNEVFDYAKPGAVKISSKDENIGYAVEVARVLGVPSDIIRDTVNNLEKPDRRGDLKSINGYKVVDHSYNISYSTAMKAIDDSLAMAKKLNMKLIVVVAGIPELGKENLDSNLKLGQHLNKVADRVILLKSILHKSVLVKSSKFVLVNNMSEVWEEIGTHDHRKNLVLLFPELNDLYY